MNATVLLLAGSETTATALSGATYLLLSNLQSLKKLQQEIRTSFDSADKITITSVSQLPYIDAVLKETLRMYPPLTSGLVRVVPLGGAEIGGHHVPENVSKLCVLPTKGAYRRENRILTECSDFS